MSTHEDSTSGEISQERRGRGVSSRLERLPFRYKLGVLVIVPLVVLGVVLGEQAANQVSQAQSASRAATLIRASAQVVSLVDDVEAEHLAALELSVHYEITQEGVSIPPELGSLQTDQNYYTVERNAVDAQSVKVRTAFGSLLPGAEAQALVEIAGLSSLRDSVAQSYLPMDNIDPAYDTVVQDLIGGLGLAQATGSGAIEQNALDALVRADAAHAEFEIGVVSAETGDTNAMLEYVGAVGAYALYNNEVARYATFATAAQSSALGGIEQNIDENYLSQQYAALELNSGNLEAGPSQVAVDLALSASTYPHIVNESRSRLGIVGRLINQIASQADGASSSAQRRALEWVALTIALFLLWLLFFVVVSRSVIRPVRRLTRAAGRVSDLAGRELARVSDEDTIDEAPPRLEAVPVLARDEIGDLAAAFNRVQDTAAKLLERQILSRRNVAEMFGNVGRRVHNLSGRQLVLIDAVERGETDAAVLERLYRIDHIAVRLQRNADSLMLLAGIREGDVDAVPMPLTDVVRMALGQIEGYQRVTLRAETDGSVAPDVIGDLVLMLAELIENAVSFSPGMSTVEVTIGRQGDGALVEIVDRGVGMTPDRFAEENARLVRRERLDLVPTKVLGLFVVGTLARRRGIRVTLGPTAGGGVTCHVWIPGQLLLGHVPPTVSTVPATAEADADAEAPSTVVAPVPAEVAATARPSSLTPVPSSGRPPALAPLPGQRHSRRAPDSKAPEQPEGTLPRRIPRHAAPTATSAVPPTAAPADDGPPPRSAPARSGTTHVTTNGNANGGGTMRLRRRIPGATLASMPNGVSTHPENGRQQVDPDEARAAIEEFEAGVDRALRDTATDNGTPRRHEPSDKPEDSQGVGQ